MTTTELAQRLLRYTKYDDLANVPVDDAIDLLEAISTGIRDWCMLSPTDFTRRTISGTLEGQATLAGCVFKSGSREFTPAANLNNLIGATCKIGSESNYNRIVGNGKLLFEAESSGSLSLLYWKDIIDIGRAAKVITDPLVRGNRLRMWKDVDRDRRTTHGGYWGPTESSIGEPRRYWVETEDSASNAPPRFLVRVWPLPSTSVQASFDVQIVAPRYSPTSLQNPEHIPVPDEYCEAMVIPLAARELVSSPIFTGSAGAVGEAGKRAEQRVSNLVPVSSTLNGVFTPGGW